MASSLGDGKKSPKNVAQRPAIELDAQLDNEVALTLKNPQTTNPERLVDLLNELATSSAKNHAVKDKKIKQLERRIAKLEEEQRASVPLLQADHALLEALTEGHELTDLEQSLRAQTGLLVELHDLTARHRVRDSGELDEAEHRLLVLSSKQRLPASGTDTAGNPLTVVAAKRGAELVGAVLLRGEQSEIGRQFVAHCAEILAGFVVAQRRLRGDIALRRSELLELVLDPPAGGLSAATMRRLAAHGIVQEEPYRIIVGVGSKQALDAIDHRLEFDFGPQLLRAIIDGELVLIINEKNFNALRQMLKGQRRRNWQGLVMGHSPRLHRVEIVPPEAAVVRRVVTTASHNRRVDAQVLVSLESYGVLGAFLSRVNIEPTRVAMRETLAPLLDYDAKHRTDLVETAFNFFNEGRNIASVAKLMHVHENTVRQRLERIAQLLGEEWSYGQAGLDYHIMLATLRLLEQE